jgi:hypothetical protein
MAEQTQPVQRKVALKVIKAGMDSRQVIARFEAERQALAMMDHVNIARVLDAGTIGSEPRTPVSGPPQPSRENESRLRGGRAAAACRKDGQKTRPMVPRKSAFCPSWLLDDLGTFGLAYHGTSSRGRGFQSGSPKRTKAAQ